MRTYHAILKRVSDGLTIRGILADGKSERGSVPYSADNSGQPGRLVLNSFHGGSGAITSDVSDNRYAEANGWDASLAGHVRTYRPAIPATTLNASYATANEQRRVEVFTHPDGEFIITPNQIFLNESSVDSLAGSGTHFTGSYAVWGDRIFFAVESNASTLVSINPCRVRDSAGTFGNTNFAASYFVIIGARLFRVIQNAAYPKVSVAWTDEQGSSTPTWFTTYTYPTPLYATDAANLQGSLMISLAKSMVGGAPGEVITMDITGSFTNVLPAGAGGNGVIRLLPFNGGLIAFLGSTLAQSLFFESVSDASPLLLHPVVDAEPIYPSAGVGGSGTGSVGFLAVSTPNLLVAAQQLNDASDEARITAVMLDEESNRMVAHSSPIGSGTVPTGARLLGGAIQEAGGLKYLRLVYMTGTPTQDDLVVVGIPLWNGHRPPDATSVVNPGGKKFRTPIYLGNSPGLKKILSIGGQTRVVSGTLDDTQTLSFTIYRIAPNGTATGYSTVTLDSTDDNIGGPFLLEMDDEIPLLRSFYLEWDFADTNEVLLDVLLPLVIDYVEFPNQSLRATLPLLLGSLQITPGGSMTNQSRKATMDDIETALKDPGPWTIEWWHDKAGTPSWTVLIESFGSKELEESVKEGDSGTAVATLVVRRINTDKRAI